MGDVRITSGVIFPKIDLPKPTSGILMLESEVTILKFPLGNSGE